MGRITKRKFKSHGDDHSSWEIVYVDFLTNMFLLFVALWIVTVLKTEATKSGKDGLGDSSLVERPLPADNWFPSGRHDILKPGRDALEAFANAVQTSEENTFGVKDDERTLLVIEGHTDSVGSYVNGKFNREGYIKNLTIGFNRGLAVYENFLNSGYAEKIGTNFSICSYGSNDPIKDEEVEGKDLKEKAKAANRRIVLKVMGVQNKSIQVE